MVPKVLFTSYLCDSSDPIIKIILNKWVILNPDYEIKYFSDNDIDIFFSTHPKNMVYKTLKNGVAKADFFRICYINKYGGYWFDIDLEPISVDNNIPRKGSIHLFDAGYGNISYMFIGGDKEQKLFDLVINEVSSRIINSSIKNGSNLINITGPRIIQKIVFDFLNIPEELRKNGIMKGGETPISYLKGSDFEFEYTKIIFPVHKSKEYEILQQKHNKYLYTMYNFI